MLTRQPDGFAPGSSSIQATAEGTGTVSTRVAAAHALPDYAATPERERLLMRHMTDSEPAVAFRAVATSESIVSDPVRTILGDIAVSHASIYVGEEAARVLAS